MERIVIDMEHLNPTAADMADTIKSAAKAAGLSQRDLANKAGIPTTTLNRKLNSGAPLHWNELRAIADAIGRTVSSLAAETEVRLAAERASAA